MSNIYNDPSSVNVKITALNNTYGYLSANIGKVKFGFATDLNKWCYSDITGTIHKTLTDSSGSSNTPIGRVFFADSNGSATSDANLNISGDTLYTPNLFVNTRIYLGVIEQYGFLKLYNGSDINILLDGNIGDGMMMGSLSIGTTQHTSKVNVHTDGWNESAIQITNSATALYGDTSGLILGIEEGNPNAFLRYNGYGNFFIRTNSVVGQPEETPLAIYNGYPAKTLTLGFDNGSVVLNNKIKRPEGTNKCAGVATLVAGSVTISNTLVDSDARIKVYVQSLGTVTRPQAVGISTRVNGTSFTIMSSSATDTSTVYWEMTWPT